MTEDPTSTSGNNVEDEDSGSSVEGGRHAIATPAQRRDITGLDLADSVFGDLDDSFEDGYARAGGRSADTSSLNLSNKRRPRQSSIIGRNDPPIRPSSRGGNTPSISSTLHFGAFKRRAREPSILGTARKQRPEETVAGLEPGSESEEDFLPEAESTPVNNRRRTQPDVEAEEEEVLPTLVAQSGSRKRKSGDVVPSSDRPEKASRVDTQDSEAEAEDANQEQPEMIDSDSESSLSSLSSPRGPPPALPDRPVTPINNEEIMAPPASSDSEEAEEIWPDIHTLAKRRRRHSVTTPVRGDNWSDVSSPPSLTHSPNYVETKNKSRGRATTKQQPSPKVTTADLANLLPKRRYKKRRDSLDSGEEYDVSGLAHGDDELSYVNSAAARRRQGSRPPSRAAQALKAKQAASNKEASASKVLTYSRRSSDKENENDEGEDEGTFHPLPDDTFENGSGSSENLPSADELRTAVKKFKEVDKWELEYEEMTQSSSPQGAR